MPLNGVAVMNWESVVSSEIAPPEQVEERSLTAAPCCAELSVRVALLLRRLTPGSPSTCTLPAGTEHDSPLSGRLTVEPY